MGDSMSTIINATTTNGVVIQPDNSGSLVLQTNSGTTALTIDTSQNVGIGTTSPARKLDISGASAAGSSIEIGNTNTQSSTIAAINTTGTTYSYAGVGGSTTWYYGNKTVALGTDSANPIQFVTNASERMRIDSSGNVLINRNSAISSAWKVQIDCTAGASTALVLNATTTSATEVQYLRNPNGIVGSIVTNGSGTSYVTTSDYRLKDNILPMTGALATVQALKPVTYKWKQDGSDGQGFIAHELAEVVPDCVSGEKDAVDEDGNIKPQGIDTSFLVATLTAAIQEQQTIINDLKARIETLEAKLG
jgi:hypothetical protein